MRPPMRPLQLISVLFQQLFHLFMLAISPAKVQGKPLRQSAPSPLPNRLDPMQALFPRAKSGHPTTFRLDISDHLLTGMVS